MEEPKSALEQLQEANLELIRMDFQIRELIRQEDELHKERDKVLRKVRGLFTQAAKEVNGE